MSKVAICVASGPSLTADDCDLAATAANWILAVNDSWRRAGWAHAVYAGDFVWWQAHRAEIPEHIECWTCSESAAYRYRLHHHRCGPGMYNSGQRAIELCIAKGFERILLLGYDCTVERGAHWHEDHPGGTAKNPDATRCRQWQDQFRSISANGAQIINCSRETALTAFPRMTLEQALAL